MTGSFYSETLKSDYVSKDIFGFKTQTIKQGQQECIGSYG